MYYSKETEKKLFNESIEDNLGTFKDDNFGGYTIQDLESGVEINKPINGITIFPEAVEPKENDKLLEDFKIINKK